MKKTLLTLSIFTTMSMANQTCTNNLRLLELRVEEMSYLLENGSQGLDLYRAAKSAKEATQRIMQVCGFDSSLNAEYRKSIDFFDKVMYDEMRK